MDHSDMQDEGHVTETVENHSVQASLILANMTEGLSHTRHFFRVTTLHDINMFQTCIQTNGKRNYYLNSDLGWPLLGISQLSETGSLLLQTWFQLLQQLKQL